MNPFTVALVAGVAYFLLRKRKAPSAAEAAAASPATIGAQPGTGGTGTADAGGQGGGGAAPAPADLDALSEAYQYAPGYQSPYSPHPAAPVGTIRAGVYSAPPYSPRPVLAYRVARIQDGLQDGKFPPP